MKYPAAWLYVISFVVVLSFNFRVMVTTNPFRAEVEVLFVAVTVDPDRLNPVLAVLTA